MGAANTRDIKRRIRSVQSTQQITRAMKMVAASRLRKAQERMLAMRPYCRDLEEMLPVVVAEMHGDDSPLFAGRPEPKSTALVVMTSDRGLCGSFNNYIIRRAERFVGEEATDRDIKLITMGVKGTKALSRLRPAGEVEHVTGAWEDVSFVTAAALAESLCDRIEAGEIDEAHILYAEFRTAATQVQVVRRLLPVKDAEISVASVEGTVFGGGLQQADKAEHSLPGMEFDPDLETVAERLYRRFVAAEIYRAMLENLASELGARMTAMDTATRNADDMIAALTLEYNKARQADITAEMLDIVGGAEALRA